MSSVDAAITTKGAVMSRHVTIGLPFSRQPEAYFRQTVRSVFAQTHADWELVLLADGAPDSLVRAAAAIDDPRVRLVVHDRSAGLAARLNEIADLATGDVLFRMDGDDVMHPQRVERQLAHLAAHPEVDVLGGGARVIDEENQLLGILKEPAIPSEPRGYLRSHTFTHPTVAARTAWFREHRYDTALLRSEDKDLWLASNATSTFAKLSEPVLFYRIARLRREKQAQDAAYDRRIMAHYGPGLVGPARTRALLARSRAKQAAFATLLALGQAERVRRTKYLSLEEPHRAEGERALQAAMTASVPGWADEPPDHPASTDSRRRPREQGLRVLR